jgi:hypothetical protein
VRAGLTWMVGLIAAALAWPGAAHAGTYVVHSCALPDGSPAPIDGWTFDSSGYRVYGNGCNAWPDPALRVLISAGAPAGAFGRWTFTSPTDTTLAGYVLYRHETASQTAGSARMVIHSWEGGGPIDGCIAWPQGCSGHGSTDPRVRFAPSNATQFAGLNVRRFTVTASCHSAGSVCDDGPGGTLEIYAARIRLTDSLPPTLDGAPRGTLVDSAADHQGIETVVVDAQDAGGGVRSGDAACRRYGYPAEHARLLRAVHRGRAVPAPWHPDDLVRLARRDERDASIPRRRRGRRRQRSPEFTLGRDDRESRDTQRARREPAGGSHWPPRWRICTRRTQAASAVRAHGSAHGPARRFVREPDRRRRSRGCIQASAAGLDVEGRSDCAVGRGWHMVRHCSRGCVARGSRELSGLFARSTSDP